MASVDPKEPKNYIVIINDGSKPHELTTVLQDLSNYTSTNSIQIVAPPSLLPSQLPDKVSFSSLEQITDLKSIVGGLKGQIDHNDRLVVIIQGTAQFLTTYPNVRTCIRIKEKECYPIHELNTEVGQLNYGGLLLIPDSSYLFDFDNFDLRHSLSSSNPQRFLRFIFTNSKDSTSYQLALVGLRFLLEKSFFHEDMDYYLDQLKSQNPKTLQETLLKLITHDNPLLDADLNSLTDALKAIVNSYNPAIPPNVKSLAIQKLGQIGKSASTALPEIENWMGLEDRNDQKKFIRDTALIAFSKIVEAHPNIIPIARRADLLEKIKRKIDSESLTIQAAAVESYGRLVFAWNNSEGIAFFKNFPFDSSRNISTRRAAIETLAYASENILLEISIKLIYNNNEFIFYKALENLDDYLEKNFLNLETIFSNYSALFNPLVDRLIVLLDEQISKSDDTRLLVVSLLIWMGKRSEKALPKLREVAQKDSSPRVKEGAAAAVRVIERSNRK